MGISTIQSYQGSQIFEAVGISKEVIDKYFTGTVSRVGGITHRRTSRPMWRPAQQPAFDPLGLDINMRAADLRCAQVPQRQGGAPVQPQTIHLFQKACWTGDYATFKQFTAAVDHMGARRDAPAQPAGLQLSRGRRHPARGGREPASSIVKRFKGAAMSYGALSEEAHECIAVAMNRLGGKQQHRRGRRGRGALRHRAQFPPSSRWPPRASA
jgi:glutamate synthase (NADPH/NADH) large chain